MYELHIRIYNMRTMNVCRTENMRFQSAWSACQVAHDISECVDVESVVVVDSETGEILWES